MATGFSVMDALNKNSKAGVDESPRARFRTKDISIFKMYRNKLNFYDLADIEELAGDILMYGLKQNLEVVRVDADKNLLLIKGAVPGAKKALITVKETTKSGK